ncbi:hypothetical protein BJP40_14660 [Streptomyces sp. CC53]|uniref:type II toxin-antitoxin system CcdA family antitoxin n=1 Tax=unclassified Streptomyces TaxID=2593676 RepID=UPI0008DD88E1|nr:MULTISPECIES: type II toxin-antitoxin system CcdA family antitoxin [unclassified Streptomyces]OII66083.1 hypothetical protein BJP40_14660 [Streptomyces sp. CC53]
MAETTRITVTLPTDDVEELKTLTDNVSAFVADAVAKKIRQYRREVEFRRYEEEHGAFTEEELAEADALIDAALNPDAATPGARAA